MLFLTVSGFAVTLLVLIARPLYFHRGLTQKEWKARWPGDEALAGTRPSGSRAVTILAPPSIVWHWVCQIGQDRGGFYSYGLLENMAGAKMPNVRELRSEWANRYVGQKLIMAPVERYGKIAEMEIVEVEEGHYMVAINNEGSWAFIVEPLGPLSCRLIARQMWIPSKNPLVHLFRALLFDPIHYVMEWKMVNQIKKLSETLAMNGRA